MSEKSRYFGLLTTGQSEVLGALYNLHSQHERQPHWRPRDLGAYKSSHHAQTLKRLADKGLVSRHKTKTGYAYALTDEGKTAWALLQDTSRIPVHSLFGGIETRRRMLALKAVVS